MLNGPYTVETTYSGRTGKWGFRMLWSYGSGFPFTPAFRNDRRPDPKLDNSRRKPANSSLTIAGDKFYRVWGQNVTLYLQGSNLLDAQNISVLQPDLWPNNQVNSTSYVVHYTETGRAGGAFLTADQDGDGIDDWFAVNDPRVFAQGRVIRVGLGVQF